MKDEILELYNKTNRFGALLGMKYQILDSGEVIYKAKITENFLATTKAAHGGFIAAFMDAVVGVAALSKVINDGKVVSTVEMKINFLKPANLGDELTGNGKVLKAGKSLIITEGKIYNQNNELIAICLATMNAYPFERLLK
jgi:acyl-CoA thioesterase